MKKLLAILLSLLLLAALLPGCDDVPEEIGGEPKDNTAAPAPAGDGGSWSIFLYLCGTDLETEAAMASENLEELFAVDWDGDVNVYVQTGGTDTWHTEGIPTESIARYHVQNGGMELVDELESANMGDAGTLYDFLSWGVGNYPADKMGFIFWNHGGGPLWGAAFDELYDNDSLSLAEMEDAFSAVNEESGAVFEMVGFDACLMATIETAAIFAPYANYMVASEEVEPGGGWQYSDWAQYLCDNSDASGAQLGQVICDGYYEKCAYSGDEGFATLSTVDLAALPALVERFDEMSGVLAGGLDDATFFANVARGATRATGFGGDTPGEGYTNQLDLGDLMYRYEDFMGEAASGVLGALEEAVVYQVKGDTHQYATGLSVFFPLNADEYDTAAIGAQGEAIIPSANYRSFVDATLNIKQEAAQSPQGAVSILEEAHYDDDLNYVMTIDPATLDFVDDVEFSLYWDLGDTFVYLGSDNEVFLDWDTGEVSDNFWGYWPMLNGSYCSFFIVGQTDEYILYSVPILLNGVETNLRVAWLWWDEEVDGQNGEFVVQGAWDGIDTGTGMSSRDIRPILDGDVIVPVFYAFGEEMEETLYGEEILIDGGVTIEYGDLEPGVYWYQFDIRDVYGSYISSDFAIYEIDPDGTIYVE